MARADEDDDTEQARQLLQDGDEFMSKGDKRQSGGREERAQHYYEKALESYQRAYQLVPKTSIYFAIANAESKLGRYEQAIIHYQKVIEEVDNADLAALAKERIKELAPNVATLVVKITPAGAELSIDAELRGVAPFEQPVMLAPGEHTITVTAQGYTPYEVVLTLKAGSRTEREIPLERISVLVKKPKSGEGEGSGDGVNVPETRFVKKPGKGTLIIGSVATGGLLAASVVTGIMGFSGSDNSDSSGTLQVVSLVAGVAALGTGGYTVYHYFGVYRPRKTAAIRHAGHPKIWWSPYVQGHGGGVAVGGLF